MQVLFAATVKVVGVRFRAPLQTDDGWLQTWPPMDPTYWNVSLLLHSGTLRSTTELPSVSMHPCIIHFIDDTAKEADAPHDVC
jgi:hypothetical protein